MAKKTGKRKLAWLGMALLLIALLALPVRAEAAGTKKVSLKAGNMELTVGTKGKPIGATVTEGATLTYKSSDETVVAVTSDGKVTAKKAGTAKITIRAKKSGYKTAKKTITVTVKKKKQTITASDKKLMAGDTLGINAKSKTKRTYSSSDKNIVTVSKDGTLTGVKEGTATVTIKAKSTSKYASASKKITVTVTKKEQKAQTIEASDIAMETGHVVPLKAKAKTEISCEVSDTAILGVHEYDGQWYVTGWKDGTAQVTITAKETAGYKGATKTISVNVSIYNIEEYDKPKPNSSQSIYAIIPDLDIKYAVRENEVKYGASCSKFVYTYYAYCVKDWGNVALKYGTVKRCTELALTESDNDAALAVFEYIRSDSSRWQGYLLWLKKALGGSVPVSADGKYRLGNNTYAAYCPYTTAKENAKLWQYVWKDGYKESKLKKERYCNFFAWTAGQIYANHYYVTCFYKNGLLDKGGELSVYTTGGFYILRLNDGKYHIAYCSILSDNTDTKKTGTNAEDVVGYLTYLGNAKLKETGKMVSNRVWDGTTGFYPLNPDENGIPYTVEIPKEQRY